MGFLKEEEGSRRMLFPRLFLHYPTYKSSTTRAFVSAIDKVRKEGFISGEESLLSKFLVTEH